jgi:CO/xanthine dehydrogenase FAD-binding subunit
MYRLPAYRRFGRSGVEDSQESETEKEKMRGAPGTMKVLRPKSVREMLSIYGRHPDAIPLAGGTDFMVAWNAGQLNGKKVLDLSQIDAWTRIRRKKSGLSIGALATHWLIQKDATVQRDFSLLAEACATIGGIQIQARGTLGGNIANASPAGDTFPPLAVYDALVNTVSLRGSSTIPFLEIFAGVKETTLEPSELIASVEIPFLSPRPTRRMFRKVGTRAASAISKTVAAGLLWLKRDGTMRELRFALGSMAPTVRRLRAVEAYVVGKKPTKRVLDKATELLAEDVSPIDDIRSTAEYRLEVCRNLLCSFLNPEFRTW